MVWTNAFHGQKSLAADQADARNIERGCSHYPIRTGHRLRPNKNELVGACPKTSTIRQTAP